MTTAAKRTIGDVFNWLFKGSVAVAAYFLMQLVGDVRGMRDEIQQINRKQDVQQVLIEAQAQLNRIQNRRIDAIQNVITTD